MKDNKLTIVNWKSELKCLELHYKKITDKECAEARGILDNLDAVRQIIREIEDKHIADRQLCS